MSKNVKNDENKGKKTRQMSSGADSGLDLQESELDLNLSQKIKKLDEKVEWFNSEEFELEKAVDNYKEALALAAEIEEDLKNLKNEVEVLEVDFSKD